MQAETKLSDLAEPLRDWGLYENYWSYRTAWRFWIKSDFRVLPFAGGFMDQPPKLMQDWIRLLQIKHMIENEPPPANSPNISKMENPPI